MPHKNTIRYYEPDGYYHVYNRGVEKRKIFLDKNDYSRFVDILEGYLAPKPPPTKQLVRNTPYWRSLLDEGEITLLCYCLMPNHFHLLLRQKSENGVTKFMRRISNAYVRHFNKKYARVGALFQGKFKAVRIDNEAYLLHLSRYIHLNRQEVGPLDNYPYSSYPNFIGKIESEWLNPNEILTYFSTTNHKLTYKNFVESRLNIPTPIDNLTLEQV
ncbi:MAG: transposase [Patescibacteria group bacterium]